MILDTYYIFKQFTNAIKWYSCVIKTINVIFIDTYFSHKSFYFPTTHIGLFLLINSVNKKSCNQL